jgi:hypothetical protein
MQATASLFMLWTFAVAVAVANICFKFKLGNGEVSPIYAFRPEDFKAPNNPQLREKVELLEIPIPLRMIEDGKILTKLTELWRLKTPAPESADGIDSELLSKLVCATGFMANEGYPSQHFAGNLMRLALQGSPSAFFKTFPSERPEAEGLDIYWQIFTEFAAQTGCEIRVSETDEEVTLYSAGVPGAKRYGVLASSFKTCPAIKKLAVRCGALGGTRDTENPEGTKGPDAPNGMTILTWFLRHLIVPSLSMGHEFKLTWEDIRCFAEAISYVNGLEWNEEIEKGMVLEGLDLSEQFLSSETIEVLIPNLPSLKDIWIGIGFEEQLISREATDAFKKCKGLEKLYLYGRRQNSLVVEELTSNIPSLKELRINVESLTSWAASAFKRSKKLERLYLYGSEQSSLFVETLLPNTPSLKRLNIRVKELSSKAEDALKECKGLEGLDLNGPVQNSPSFVEALAFNLSSLKELVIRVQELNLQVADAFKGLEMLAIVGRLNSGFFKHILSPPLTGSLKTLRVFKTEGSQDLSDEDDQAILAAQARSIQVYNC